MVLIIDSILGNNLSLLQELYNSCSEFCRKSILQSCLIFCSKREEDKAWIRPFVFSLRAAGVQRINLVIPTSAFAPEDLPSIIDLGIREIILVENSYGTHFINDERMGVRVWLSRVEAGKNHEKMSLWNSFVKNLLSMELSPFKFLETKLPASVDFQDQKPEKECGWEKAVMTISLNGSIVPNIQAPVLSKNIVDPAQHCSLVHSFDYLKSKLPFHIFCNQCYPFSLLELPQWLFTPDTQNASETDERFYFDHIRNDINKVSDQKRNIARSDFMQRVRSNAKKSAI